MMKKKTKIAGTDRPYTLTDLGNILRGFIADGDWENKAGLDYYSPWRDETPILTENFRSYSITEFGSNEGIYTVFYIEDYYGKWKYRLLTAKTLSQTEDAFVKMNEMAGYVCYKFNRFVDNNLDNFVWSGFDVSYTLPNGKEVLYCWCSSLDRVANAANELRKSYGDTIKVYYIEKATRKKREYKF